MKSAKTITDSELQKYSNDHLVYEIGMLFWTSAILLSIPDSPNMGVFAQTVKNSLLNSYANHSRNLIDFLYLKNHYNREKASDILVEDYIQPRKLTGALPSITPLLEEAKIKANKQVAHLTVERLQYEVNGKGWRYMEIYTQIMKAFLKISTLFPAPRVSKNFVDLISKKQVIFPKIESSEIFEKGQPVGVMIRSSLRSEITLASAIKPVAQTG